MYIVDSIYGCRLTVSKNLHSFCVTANYISGAILSFFTKSPVDTVFLFFSSLFAEMNRGESNAGGGDVLGAFIRIPLTQFVFRHSLRK